MKSSQLIACAVLCLSALSLHAQDLESIKWGKIPDADLKMTVYAKDTAAEAVVLANVANLTYNLVTDNILLEVFRHRRIKILKRSGFGQGDISLEYIHSDRDQLISELKAQIFNPDGTKRSVERKDFFEEKVSEHVTRIKFAFPEVKEGSVIEFKYRHTYKGRVVSLPKWYFQEEIPVVLSSFQASIPDYFDYVVMQTGVPPQVMNSDDVPPPVGSNIKLKHYMFVASDMPAMRPESFITTMDDYLSSIKMQLRGTRPNGGYEPYLADWKTVAESMWEDENFGKKVKRKGSYEAANIALQMPLDNATTPESKVKIIYDFVREKMEWDGSHSLYAFQALEKAFEQKKGSLAEINLLLVALLKANGLEAHPLLTSTRDHGATFDNYPILSQFNYVLAHVKLGEKDIILDATNPYLPMGTINEDALNSQGWLVNPALPVWVPIKANVSASALMMTLKIEENGTLKGKESAIFEGYEAADYRKELKEDKEEAKAADKEKEEEEEVASIADAIKYDSMNVVDQADVYKPLRYNAKIHIDDAATINDDFIYVNPVLHPSFEKNPFKQTERLYPVDLPYPLSLKYVLNLDIPTGYVVDDLPEQVKLVLPENGGQFIFLTQQTGNRVQVTSTIKLNQLHFEAEEYTVIKKFFDLIIEKQQEQIVLKKGGTASKDK
jgi:hypothetical protein